MTTTVENRTVESRLEALGHKLPELSKPVASYVPYVVTGNLVVLSGQLPLGIGDIATHTGQLGKNFTVEQGKRTAEVCALNVIAQVKEACGGDLERVVRCVRLGVFVNSTGDFTEHPQVANGASDLIKQAFGAKGEHARSAIGVSQLPRGVAVEVEAIFEIA